MSVNDLLNMDLTVVLEYINDAVLGTFIVLIPIIIIAVVILRIRDKRLGRR